MTHLAELILLKSHAFVQALYPDGWNMSQILIIFVGY